MKYIEDNKNINNFMKHVINIICELNKDYVISDIDLLSKDKVMIIYY